MLVRLSSLRASALGSSGLGAPARALAAALALVCLLSSPDTVAQYATTYPGSNCKWYGPQSLDNDFVYSGGNATGIKNGSGAAKKIVCPMMKRMNYGGMDPGIDEAFLTYSGGSTAWASSGCSLRATGENGTSAEEWVAPTPTLGAHGIVWAAWSVPDFASYAFYCASMPVDQWIYKYEIVESGAYSEFGTGISDTVIPGSACRYYGPQASDADLDFVGGNATGLENTGSAVSVTCPIVRWQAEDQGNIARRVFVKTDDLAGWQNGDCVLATSSWNGANVWNESLTYSTSGPGAGFSSGWFARRNGFEYGAMALHCTTFRADAWIYNIRVQQN
jgi:hypothetical protein